MHEKQNYRMYKGIKIEYYYNGTKREYQTTFANIGRYTTLKTIQELITSKLKKKYGEPERGKWKYGE